MTGHGPGSERINDGHVPEKVHWHDAHGEVLPESAQANLKAVYAAEAVLRNAEVER